MQTRNLKFDLGPGDEALEVVLVDAANGVDVGARAVVLGQVPDQRLTDVGRAQDEQAAAAGAPYSDSPSASNIYSTPASSA